MRPRCRPADRHLSHSRGRYRRALVPEGVRRHAKALAFRFWHTGRRVRQARVVIRTRLEHGRAVPSVVAALAGTPFGLRTREIPTSAGKYSLQGHKGIHPKSAGLPARYSYSQRPVAPDSAGRRPGSPAIIKGPHHLKTLGQKMFGKVADRTGYLRLITWCDGYAHLLLLLGR